MKTIIIRAGFIGALSVVALLFIAGVVSTVALTYVTLLSFFYDNERVATVFTSILAIPLVMVWGLISVHVQSTLEMIAEEEL